MDAGTPSTTGVRANDLAPFTRLLLPAAATRSVQTVEAGDQIVGQSSWFARGHRFGPALRISAPMPDDTLIGAIVAHSFRPSASGESLKASPRSSIRVTFSEEVATTTRVQLSPVTDEHAESAPNGRTRASRTPMRRTGSVTLGSVMGSGGPVGRSDQKKKTPSRTHQSRPTLAVFLPWGS